MNEQLNRALRPRVLWKMFEFEIHHIMKGIDLDEAKHLGREACTDCQHAASRWSLLVDGSQIVGGRGTKCEVSHSTCLCTHRPTSKDACAARLDRQDAACEGNPNLLDCAGWARLIKNSNQQTPVETKERASTHVRNNIIVCIAPCVCHASCCRTPCHMLDK